MAPVLSAVELTKRLDDLTAVSNLSFDLEAGSVTGFLGPNGERQRDARRHRRRVDRNQVGAIIAMASTPARSTPSSSRPSHRSVASFPERPETRFPVWRTTIFLLLAPGTLVILAWTVALIVGAAVHGDRSDI